MGHPQTPLRLLGRQGLLIPRYIYFSFHYQRDIRRAQQVKNNWVTKSNYKSAGYFDGSLEEKAKKETNLAVKRAINRGMVGSSVACVLIGAETATREWVAYEIFKSLEEGMGVFGINIHLLKDPTFGTDTMGTSPFDNLGYMIIPGSTKLQPVGYYGEWRKFQLADPVEPSCSQHLIAGQSNNLANKFPIYDWVLDDGYNNLPDWANAAAKVAGR